MVRLHEHCWGANEPCKSSAVLAIALRRYLREGGVVAYRQPVRRTQDDLTNRGRLGTTDVVRLEGCG